ncbi:MAG: hypothetical protein SFY32_10680, partial [Bacteroidota bacterium]|nr:hypothetical protein [Bacteroidota bacterium]
MKKTVLLTRWMVIASIALISYNTQAQRSQGIGTNNPNPKAVLDLNASWLGTNPQGFLPPALSTANRTTTLGPTLTAADNGLIVYDNQINAYFYWNGATWVQIADATSGWVASGGNLYFLTGNVGIGTSTPNEKFTLVGNASVVGTSFLQNTYVSGLTLTGPSLQNGILSVTGTGEVVTVSASAFSQWSTNGTTISYNGGNVGIGVTNPANATLEILGTLSASGIGYLNGFVNTSFSNLGNTTISGGASITGLSAMQSARIEGLSNGVLSVDGAGNVVLAPSSGTTYTSILGVNGIVATGNGTGEVTITGYQWTTVGGNLVYDGGSSISGIGQVNGLINSGFANLGNTTITGGASITGLAAMQSARIESLSNGVLSVDGVGNIITTPAVFSQWNTNGTTISYNTGNVGIGVTSPTNAALEILGNLSASGIGYLNSIISTGVANLGS